jgi:NAD(P)-dependent dehydrogenase (short-subunit alcohol dehydrogenase family)
VDDEAVTPRFNDRVVIITGAAGQIGVACVTAFLEEGASVGAIDMATMPASGSRVKAVTADLSVESQIDEAFRRIEDALGPVDVLVQSAAVMVRRPFLEITADDIDHVFATNVRAVLLAGRVAAASMIARNARDAAIVNLTSTSAVLSEATSVAYEASKGAVNMATKGMATALAPYGIRVNAVGPGSMAKAQDEIVPRDIYALDDYERRRVPLGRLGTGANIADAVLFLASPAAAYVTGAVLYVDGGTLAAW